MKYSLTQGKYQGQSPRDFPRGSGYISSYFPTGVTIQTFSIKTAAFPSWLSVLEKLIICIALTAGQYGKILPSRLSNTGELNFNIIMFSN